MKKTFLFDLDGTLLPLDMDSFMHHYFKGVAKLFNELNLDFESAKKGFFAGTIAMMNNDGSQTNEQAFWNTFKQMVDYNHDELYPRFEQFYENEFQQYKQHTGVVEGLNEKLKALKDSGHRLLVATNPLFPKQASYSRVTWADLDPELFEEITTYEDYHFCKPNINYYKELIERFDINPKNTIMVGNDAQEDLVVKELGIETYLVTDHLIDRNDGKYITDHQGTMSDFLEYLNQFITVK